MKNRVKKLFDAGMSVFRLYTENDMNVYAGYATLFVITSSFPSIMLIITVINLIPEYSPSSITDYVFNYLPDLPALKNLFYSTVTNLKEQSTGLLASISALTTLWSASYGVSSLQRGLEKLSQRGSRLVRDKAIALVFTLIYVILIPAMILFNVLGNAVTELVQTVAGHLGAGEAVKIAVSFIHTSRIIIAIAGVLAILLTYAFLPGRRVPLKTQFPGTVFTVVLWVAFTKLFSFFIPRFYRASSIYGSLASLFLMLMWLRYVIMIFYYGAALNSVLANKEDNAREEVRMEDPPGNVRRKEHGHV